MLPTPLTRRMEAREEPGMRRPRQAQQHDRSSRNSSESSRGLLTPTPSGSTSAQCSNDSMAMLLADKDDDFPSPPRGRPTPLLTVAEFLTQDPFNSVKPPPRPPRPSSAMVRDVHAWLDETTLKPSSACQSQRTERGTHCNASSSQLPLRSGLQHNAFTECISENPAPDQSAGLSLPMHPTCPVRKARRLQRIRGRRQYHEVRHHDLASGGPSNFPHHFSCENLPQDASGSRIGVTIQERRQGRILRDHSQHSFRFPSLSKPPSYFSGVHPPSYHSGPSSPTSPLTRNFSRSSATSSFGCVDGMKNPEREATVEDGILDRSTQGRTSKKLVVAVSNFGKKFNFKKSDKQGAVARRDSEDEWML